MADQKPYNSPALDDIRARIDALDDKIHDTLMQRAALVLQIGEEKRKKGIPVVQPAREARMIRRLLDRHEGALPEMAVVRIWRELVGAVSMLQTGLKVIVAADETHPAIWDMARDYFGSCLPMSRVGTPLSAIADVREDRANFAVLPWPQDEEAQPWWSYLEAENPAQRMQIIVRLPHGDDPADVASDKRALVVAKSGFDDSGADHSFLFVRCKSETSRARLVDHARKAGLEAVSLVSTRADDISRPTWHLMEVKGYIGDDHKSVKEFLGVLDDAEAQVTCVGGFPVPPVYAKTIRPSLSGIPSAPREKAAK